MKNIKDIFTMIYTDLTKNNIFSYYDDELTMTSSEFILTYDKENYIFYVSFSIGMTCKKTAEYMKIFLSYIERPELYIYNDFYYDPTKKEVSYGYEAINNKQSAILKSSGKDKCPMCERILPLSYFKDNICKSCVDNFDTFIWC